MKHHVSIVIIFFLTFFPQILIGYPIAPFPGLNTLIVESDIVAIADVWERDKECGDYETHRVQVVHCLKGDIPDWKEIKVGMLNTPIGKPVEFLIAPNRYILFLREKDTKPEYMTLFYKGSLLEISRKTNWVTISQSKSTKDAIIEFLKDALEKKQQELDIFKKEIEIVLKTK